MYMQKSTKFILIIIPPLLAEIETDDPLYLIKCIGQYYNCSNLVNDGPELK